MNDGKSAGLVKLSAGWDMDKTALPNRLIVITLPSNPYSKETLLFQTLYLKV